MTQARNTRRYLDVATTNAAAPEILPGPTPGQVALNRGRASRSATLAALEDGNLEDSPPAPSSPAATATPEPAAGDSPDRELGAEVTADKRPAPDTEESKRLASIQANEKRAKDKIATERAAARAEVEAERKKLADDRAAFDAQRAELDAYKKALERAAVDPVGVMEALKMDLEYSSKLAYAKAKGDPTQREAAAAAMRAREIDDKTTATEKRLAELEQKLAAKDQQTEFESRRSAYLDHAVKAVGDDAPIAKALAAKNPAKLRAALWATAERLIEENDGDVPDFEDVVVTFERNWRAELEELGIDPATLAKTATTTKQNNETADKKHPAKTLGNDLSTPRVPRPNRSEREGRAETLALLEAGKLD